MKTVFIRSALAITTGVVCAAVLAGPAGAQDVPPGYEPVIVENCVMAILDAETAPDAGPEQCVGNAAMRCTYGPGGASTAGETACYMAETAQWDVMLNAAYAELKALDERADQDLGDAFPGVPRLAPSLQQMQRAWIAYRDATCTYEAAHWGGGTGAGPATAACMMVQTAQQTIVLRRRIADYGPMGD